MSTGWRRLIGCLTLQVIFRKRATKYISVLREMTYKDKASYESLPPCRLPANPIFLDLNQISHLNIPSKYIHVYVCIYTYTYIYKSTYIFEIIGRGLSLKHFYMFYMIHRVGRVTGNNNN